VRLADAGESVVDALERLEISETNEDDLSEERTETLAGIICRAGDESETNFGRLIRADGSGGTLTGYQNACKLSKAFRL
jgi:hypothetical protein